MTKKLSPEQLEEIHELNEKLAEMYGDSSGDRPVIRQLLGHINALENEGIEAELVELDFENNTATFEVPNDVSWIAGKYKIVKMEKRNDNQ